MPGSNATSATASSCEPDVSARPRTSAGTPPPAASACSTGAVAILRAVEDGARSFTDIVDATGLTRSTAHRLIQGLEDHGFLLQIGGLGYALGPRLLALAASASRDLPLRELAHPSLERLARSTGESAQLYVRDGDRRVCIDASESESELRTIVDDRRLAPAHEGLGGDGLPRLGRRARSRPPRRDR